MYGCHLQAEVFQGLLSVHEKGPSICLALGFSESARHSILGHDNSARVKHGEKNIVGPPRTTQEHDWDLQVTRTSLASAQAYLETFSSNRADNRFTECSGPTRTNRDAGTESKRAIPSAEIAKNISCVSGFEKFAAYNASTLCPPSW